MFDIALLSDYVRILLAWFSGITVGSVFLLWITGTTKKALSLFLGEMEEGEIEKFSILGLCFGVIIAAYWMLRTMKEAIFFELVGKQYQPIIKMLSPIILTLVLFIYSKIVDIFKKHQLFWVICTFYSVLFATIGMIWSLNLPEIHHPLIDWIPGRFIGWALFAAVESFGGIIVGAVFWGFVASTTKTASAKKGYPLIFAGAQMGNFCGPALNAGYAIALGNKVMILIASGLILLVPIIMQIYMAVIPAHLHESDYKNESKKKTGALEGLRLIITKPFLMGVLVVSTVYEIIGTVIDYQFKIFAAEYYVGSHYTVFMSFFGMCSATLGLFFTLFGIGMLIRQIGVSRCLLGYPLVLGITVLSLWKMPSLAAFFVAMMAVKAFSYCLNAPIKELLYLPTSKDVKYKAKSFIDGLGIKSAKSAGASIGHAFRSNLPALLQFGSIVSLGVIAIWIVVAIALGNRYDRLIKEKEIIE